MDCKLQTLYARILNLFYPFTSRIDEKKRNDIITIAFAFISLLMVYSVIAEYYDFPPISETQKMLIATPLLFIITVLSINAPLKPVEWNRLFYWVYFLFAVWMFAICFIHHTGIGIRPFSLMLIFIFPCLYLVWNNRGDYELLFDKMAWGIIISAFAFFIAQGYGLLYGDSVVKGATFLGITQNPNTLGALCISFIIASVYIGYRHRKYRILAVTVFAIAAGLTILSQSRGAMLSILMALIVFLVFWCGDTWKRNKRLFLIILFIFVSSFAIIGCIFANDSAYNDGSKQQKSNEIKNEFSISYGNTVEESINDVSSGRLYLWKYYFNHLTILGDDYTPAHSKMLTEKKGLLNPHNAILDYACRCGIPAGILFLLIEIMSAVFLIRSLFNIKQRGRGLLFSAMTIAAYGVEANVESIYLPSYFSVSFSFFIVLMVVGACKRDIPTSNR